jgi:large subunit ribosomal protein L31
MKGRDAKNRDQRLNFSSNQNIMTGYFPSASGSSAMKADIHPNYREVVFQDLSSDLVFKTRSTVQTKETIEFEGAEYPLVKVEVSSKSHPFYTGKHKIMDTGGRVDKFKKRYGK